MEITTYIEVELNFFQYFFPIRISQHFMHRAMHFFGGDVSSNVSEEMLIEGNILFKDTDMDICLGNPVYPVKSWNYLHRKALAHFVREKHSFDEMFNRAESDASRGREGGLLEGADDEIDKLFGD